MQFDDAMNAIILEYHRAVGMYPEWPTDPIHAAAVVSEEAGELIQASLDHAYKKANHHGKDTINRMRKEAVQTGAMVLRFLVRLEKYEANNRQA